MAKKSEPVSTTESKPKSTPESYSVRLRTPKGEGGCPIYRCQAIKSPKSTGVNTHRARIIVYAEGDVRGGSQEIAAQSELMPFDKAKALAETYAESLEAAGAARSEKNAKGNSTRSLDEILADLAAITGKESAE